MFDDIHVVFVLSLWVSSGEGYQWVNSGSLVEFVVHIRRHYAYTFQISVPW